MQTTIARLIIVGLGCGLGSVSADDLASQDLRVVVGEGLSAAPGKTGALALAPSGEANSSTPAARAALAAPALDAAVSPAPSARASTGDRAFAPAARAIEEAVERTAARNADAGPAVAARSGAAEAAASGREALGAAVAHANVEAALVAPARQLDSDKAAPKAARLTRAQMRWRDAVWRASFLRRRR